MVNYCRNAINLAHIYLWKHMFSNSWWQLILSSLPTIPPLPFTIPAFPFLLSIYSYWRRMKPSYISSCNGESCHSIWSHITWHYRSTDYYYLNHFFLSNIHLYNWRRDLNRMRKRSYFQLYNRKVQNCVCHSSIENHAGSRSRGKIVSKFDLRRGHLATGTDDPAVS